MNNDNEKMTSLQKLICGVLQEGAKITTGVSSITGIGRKGSSTANISSGRNSILPLVCAVSSTIDFDTANLLAKDFQVYKLQMAAHSLTGMIISESEETNGEILDDDPEEVTTTEISLSESINIKNVGQVKNLFTLSPSWTQVRIPIVGTSITKEVKGSIGDKSNESTSDKLTTSYDSYKGKFDKKSTENLGSVQEITISLATQAIGYDIDGTTLAGSLFHKMSSELDSKYYGFIVGSIREMFSKVTSGIKSKIQKIFYNKITSAILSLTPFGGTYKETLRRISETDKSYEFPTIILDSSDILELELSSRLILRTINDLKINIIVHDKKRRMVYMYIYQLSDLKNANSASISKSKNIENWFSHDKFSNKMEPIIIKYSDSKLGRFRFLSSVDVQ